MRKGFTLIELVIVLIIISLSIALVSPSLLRFSKTAELRGTAQKISGVLRHSRSEAVNKGRIYQVIFDPETREVRVKSIVSEEEEKEDKEQEKKPFVKVYSFSEWIHLREMKIGPSPFSSEMTAIEFYPNGGSNGGSFLLEGEDHKGYRIQVHFLTGMVKIEKV